MKMTNRRAETKSTLTGANDSYKKPNFRWGPCSIDVIKKLLKELGLKNKQKVQ